MPPPSPGARTLATSCRTTTAADRATDPADRSPTPCIPGRSTRSRSRGTASATSDESVAASRLAPQNATPSRLRRPMAVALAAVSRGSAAAVRRLDDCVADDLGRSLAATADHRGKQLSQPPSDRLCNSTILPSGSVTCPVTRRPSAVFSVTVTDRPTALRNHRFEGGRRPAPRMRVPEARAVCRRRERLERRVVLVGSRVGPQVRRPAAGSRRAGPRRTRSRPTSPPCNRAGGTDEPKTRS